MWRTPELEKPSRPDITAVMPVGSRHDDVQELVDKYAQGLQKAEVTFELIVVLDGPCGTLAETITSLMASRPWLRLIRLPREFGESVALTAGFDEARGKLILTLPPHYQIVPSELEKVIAARNEADMTIAVRWPRAGSKLESWRRSAFHGLLRAITGQRYRDLGCNVRLFTQEIAEEIPLYGERHRFYPALARSRGFRVAEAEVAQSSKDNNSGRYRLRQYLHRLLDILTIFFVARFTKKPLRFFGTIGLLSAALGMLFVAVLIVERMFFGVALADRPALLLSSLMIALGIQIFALGLIGELIIFTHARELKEYVVRDIVSQDGGDGPDAGRDQ